jgi:hypothetical protein
MKLLLGILTIIGMVGTAAILFVGPVWYIWNHIVSIKFNLPQFTFWEAFLTLLMIHLINPSSYKIK